MQKTRRHLGFLIRPNQRNCAGESEVRNAFIFKFHSSACPVPMGFPNKNRSHGCYVAFWTRTTRHIVRCQRWDLNPEVAVCTLFPLPLGAHFCPGLTVIYSAFLLVMWESSSASWRWPISRHSSLFKPPLGHSYPVQAT